MDMSMISVGLAQYLCVVIIITFHEFGHAWMASRCGDDTARHEGRVTLNPLAKLMMPHHANLMGNVFGGVILSMVDRAAAVSAIRHARRQCVTVSVDKVDFKE